MGTVRVKPLAGATVYYPGTRTAMPESGSEIEIDTYWQRRINDGSVVVVLSEPETIKSITSGHIQQVDKEADTSAASNTSRGRGGNRA